MAAIGPDAVVSFGVLFSHPATTIGRSAYIGPYGVIGEVSIGDDVLIGSQVSIMNGAKQHGIERLDIPVANNQANGRGSRSARIPGSVTGRSSWPILVSTVWSAPVRW